jgi:hypothetical protein
MARDMPVEAVRAHMMQHFDGTSSVDKPDDQNSRWAKLWENDFLPWDRGLPNPALEDTLAQRKGLIGSPMTVDAKTGKERRKRAFVPGCGRGYDVLLLASFGYDAYGLDVSEKAVDLCREWAKEHAEDYNIKDEAVGRGTVTFIAADFFSDEWRKGLEGDVEGFEVLYDYTV